MSVVGNLDARLPAQVQSSPLAEWLYRLCRDEVTGHVLEIGSGSGTGSTRWILDGLEENQHRPTLHCMEMSRGRIEQLLELYGQHPQVQIHGALSVTPEDFTPIPALLQLMLEKPAGAMPVQFQDLLDWRNVELQYARSGIPVGGIRTLLDVLPGRTLDLVLIDGSEFTGEADLREVFGASILVLNDILTPKNLNNFRQLMASKEYTLLHQDRDTGNGFGIFIHHQHRVKQYDTILPWIEQCEGYMMPGQERWLFEKANTLAEDAILVEVGAYRGLSTVALAAACRGTSRHLYTIDPWQPDPEQRFGDEDYEQWTSRIQALKLMPWVTELRGKSGEVLARWREQNLPTPVHLIFIDGSHEAHDVGDDLRLALDLVHPGGWICFHDVIHTWPGPWAIWHGLARFLLQDIERCGSIAAGRRPVELPPIQTGRYRGFPETFPPSIGKNHPKDMLPVHFLTIVLNGMPFLPLQLEMMASLPFPWHWHVVEGAAELVDDTAWSVPQGGHIPAEYHHDGLSVDGTTTWLDEARQQWPSHISIYRKARGEFWQGKTEMVNRPLSSVPEECLLWQLDGDELWTPNQISRVCTLFLENPHKTAAWYWCHFFVGEHKVITSRGGYANNPGIEWLRTWRYHRGAQFSSHEPPLLVDESSGESEDVGTQDPFTHQETEADGLTFQHYAYVLESQLDFKQRYYGYAGAVEQWKRLQTHQDLPLELDQFLPWVGAGVQVNDTDSVGLIPLLKRDPEGNWCPHLPPLPGRLVVDGVMFQVGGDGIRRVWRQILAQWLEWGLGEDILLLDRDHTCPDLNLPHVRVIQPYDDEQPDGDRIRLQQVCDEENACVFISTWYTTPIHTPGILLIHDMIPERLQWDMDHPMWRDKHRALLWADQVACVSQHTARDLLGIFPDWPISRVVVAPNQADTAFHPADVEQVNQLREQLGLEKPWWLIVGSRDGYKNVAFFLKVLATMPFARAFTVLCVSEWPLEPDLMVWSNQLDIRNYPLSDEELRAAYSGALALIYPSLYEGFGLPVVEAQACACPVITTQVGPLPEVAGQGAFYVTPGDEEGLASALCRVIAPATRRRLVRKGLANVSRYQTAAQARILWSLLHTVAISRAK